MPPRSACRKSGGTPLFRVFTGFASRIRSRAAKPATYENLWVFLRSDALVVRAGWNIRGCNPLSTPGLFDNLCGDGLLPPRSLCQSALPIVRATAFAEGLGGLSECEGHRLPPCNGPSFPARMPPVPEPLGDGGLRYPRWMAFCDCRRPPFFPALPVSTPTPPAGAAAAWIPAETRLRRPRLLFPPSSGLRPPPPQWPAPGL